VKRVVALVSGDELRAPAPGIFHLRIAADHLIAPDDVIGELDIPGSTIELVAPRVHGVVELVGSGLGAEPAAHRAVGYGDVLFRVVAAAAIGTTTAELDPAPAATDHGLVFRAPTSGRYYGRPAPDKPAFVEAGTELAPGTTICLLEVMKTFNRVTYSGAPARVRDVLVADGADVSAGEPLLALEAAPPAVST
jgi:acetyl-CoA carboxylase biotin carboxyl carrier protein